MAQVAPGLRGGGMLEGRHQGPGAGVGGGGGHLSLSGLGEGVTTAGREVLRHLPSLGTYPGYLQGPARCAWPSPQHLEGPPGRVG